MTKALMEVVKKEFERKTGMTAKTITQTYFNRFVIVTNDNKQYILRGKV